jgi:MYXO-CTERM domain-containing protein
MSVATVFKIGLIAGAAMAASATYAAGYCIAGGGGADSPMSVSDVTYSIDGPSGTPQSNATDCYGFVAKAPGGGTITVGEVNTIWQNYVTPIPQTTAFEELVKDDVGGGGTSGTTALGYTWDLTSVADPSDGSMGTWVLSIVPATTLVPAQYFDFVVALKGSTAVATYFFDQALFDGSGGGTWQFVFSPGASPNFGDLSNLTIFGRTGDPTEPPELPLPGTLALLGLGLVGLGAVRRRRFAHS